MIDPQLLKTNLIGKTPFALIELIRKRMDKKYDCSMDLIKRLIIIDSDNGHTLRAVSVLIGKMAPNNSGTSQVIDDLEEDYRLAFKRGLNKEQSSFYAINRYTNNMVDSEDFDIDAVRIFLLKM